MRRGSITPIELVILLAIAFAILRGCMSSSWEKQVEEPQRLDIVYERAISEHSIDVASTKELFSMCMHDDAMRRSIQAIWRIVPDNVKKALDKDKSKTMLIVAEYIVVQYAKHASEDIPVQSLTSKSDYANTLYNFFRPSGSYVINGFDATFDKDEATLKLALQLDYGCKQVAVRKLALHAASLSLPAQKWVAEHVQEVADSKEFRQIVSDIVKGSR